MNFRTRNWLDRFAHLCSVTPEDTGAPPADSGGGGGEPAAAAEPAPEPAGPDLTSTDPDVMVTFPKGTPLNEEQLAAYMRWNPGAKKKAPVEEPPAEPVAPAPKGKTAKDPATPPVDPKAKPAPVYDPTMKRWRDPVTNKIVPAPKGAKAPAPPEPTQEEKIAQAVAKGIKDGQPPAPKAEPAPQDGKLKAAPPFYGEGGSSPALSIPPQLMEAINSEDPAEQARGMNAVVNGLANTVMQDMMGAVPHIIAAAVKASVERISQTNTQQKTVTDFYGAYPALNKPVFHPAIAAISKQVAARWAQEGRSIASAQGLDPDFMADVALTFSEEAGIPLEEEAPLLSPPVVTKSPPTYIRRGSSARPPVASSAQNKSAEINAVVNSRGG